MDHPVTTHYNLVLVGLSYVISVLGSFTALRLLRQGAGAVGRDRVRALAAGALAMGGGAIWSMHFIGMLAFDMGMPVSYDIPTTLASLVVSVLVTGFGIWVVGLGPRRPLLLVAGGTAMGVGVAAMHYSGMAAMRMQASLGYDMKILTLSVVIAVVASIAALWLVFHAARGWQRATSAVVMGLAVCGMHYTGMRAAIMRHDAALPAAAPGFSPEILAYVIFLITLVILSVSALLVGGREHARIQRLA